MRIGIFVNTPAQVHFYKNIRRILLNHGHEIYFLARDYGETIDVLTEEKIPHYIFSNPPKSKIGKVLTVPFDLLDALSYLKRKKINLLTGFGGYEAYSSFFLHIPSIVFIDSEFSINNISYNIQQKIFVPLVDAIINPEGYRQDLGSKQFKIKSFKELSYLHHKYYTPNPDILAMLGLSENEDYVIIRINAFDAVHDFGIKGFDESDLIRLVSLISKFARVFISAERRIPSELKDRILEIPKSRIHDALFYSKLFITDTQTMATEAAILGVPTVRYNSFVGTHDMSNFIELEDRYGLIFNVNTVQNVIEKSLKLIMSNSIKEEWHKKRTKLLNEKIDICKFMVWLIERYPASIIELQHNPNLQKKFEFQTEE